MLKWEASIINRRLLTSPGKMTTSLKSEHHKSLLEVIDLKVRSQWQRNFLQRLIDLIDRFQPSRNEYNLKRWSSSLKIRFVKSNSSKDRCKAMTTTIRYLWLSLNRSTLLHRCQRTTEDLSNNNLKRAATLVPQIATSICTLIERDLRTQLALSSLYQTQKIRSQRARVSKLIWVDKNWLFDLQLRVPLVLRIVQAISMYLRMSLRKNRALIISIGEEVTISHHQQRSNKLDK